MKGRERKGEGKEREAGPSLSLPNSPRHWVRRAFAASGTLGDLTWLEDFLTSK